MVCIACRAFLFSRVILAMGDTDVKCLYMNIQVETAEVLDDFIAVLFALVGSLVWVTFYFKCLIPVALLVIINF